MGGLVGHAGMALCLGRAGFVGRFVVVVSSVWGGCKVGNGRGGVKARMALMVGCLGESLSVFGLIHALEEIKHGIDGGE